MLLVRATARPSSIHNIGLFADEKIPKGTVIWKFNSRFDIAFTPEEVEQMGDIQKQLIDYWAYQSTVTGNYIYSIDDSRFVNHASKIATMESVADTGGEDLSVARRDIEIGEELTEDYRTFDSHDADEPEEWLKD